MHIIEVINGQKRALNLCEKCAREIQKEGLFGLLPQMNLHSFLSGLLNQTFGSPAFEEVGKQKGKVCGRCGLSEAQFAKRGLLGCSECYKYFSDRLEPVLRRIHGYTRHVGKVPGLSGEIIKTAREIEKLRALLRDAISKEDFEKAAEIRDTIREMERQIKSEGDGDGDVRRANTE